MRRSGEVLAIVVLGATAALGSAHAAMAGAELAPKRYLRWTLVDSQPIAGTGVTARTTVRFVSPADWNRHPVGAARYQFRTGHVGGCLVTIKVFDRVVTGPPDRASDRLRAGLPARSARHVLDQGERGPATWRVVREKGAQMTGRYLVRSPRLEKALGSAELAVWHEVDMTTIPHGECHSGHYRRLGEQIGDSLATVHREAAPTT